MRNIDVAMLRLEINDGIAHVVNTRGQGWSG